jgi:hypothetical protein
MGRLTDPRIFWLVVAAFVAVGSLLVLLGDGSRGFWTKHPMSVSILSGVFLLAFASLVVQKLLHGRELKRWEQVAKLACHTLADGVTSPVVVGLAGLYAGRDVEARGAWDEQRDTRALQPIMELRRLPDGVETIRVFDAPLPSLAPGEGGLIPQQRLCRLLHDQQWTEWAIQHLKDLRIHGREVAAGWAPILIAADTPRALLNYVAQLNDQLGWLRMFLEKTNRHRLARRHDDLEKAVDEVLRRWQLVDARARLLTNFLWKEALRDEEFPPYQYMLPSQLGDISLSTAFREPKRIGKWCPRVEVPTRSRSPIVVQRVVDGKATAQAVRATASSLVVWLRTACRRRSTAIAHKRVHR